MAVNLSIKNVPDDLAERLRRRAARNHRSLQGELMTILEEAVEAPQARSLEEVAEEVRALGLRTADESAEMIRADREQR